VSWKKEGDMRLRELTILGINVLGVGVVHSKCFFCTKCKKSLKENEGGCMFIELFIFLFESTKWFDYLF
jgi:hypothetical protein